MSYGVQPKTLNSRITQVSEFKEQLLISAGVSPERIVEFSCGMFESCASYHVYSSLEQNTQNVHIRYHLVSPVPRLPGGGGGGGGGGVEPGNEITI